MKKGRIKSRLISFVAAAALIAAPGTVLADSNSNAHIKVTICHATGSQSNPYVMITPDANGVINGHVSHQDGRDIIPPFDYNDHGTIKHFPGQNFDASGQAILANGCVVEGGQGGGPQKDCDNDFDNSPASECTPPQPQTDCDNDTDNSPAAECETGGMGGGPTTGGTTTTTTTTSTGQVLAASTTTGSQVAVVPTGSVNGGEGAASRAVNSTALAGLMGSLLSTGLGLSLLNKRQS
jgi:hypothetical protein